MPVYGFEGREIANTDLGSRSKVPPTTIGEEEGHHDGDRETLRTPGKKSSVIRERYDECDQWHTFFNTKIACEGNGGIH